MSFSLCPKRPIIGADNIRVTVVPAPGLILAPSTFSLDRAVFPANPKLYC